jgi:predicted RNA-binding protein
MIPFMMQRKNAEDEKPRKHVNLFPLPTGARYEDTYGAYLDIFKDIAETPTTHVVEVARSPVAWVPLLRYLGCDVVSVQEFFEHDRLISGMLIDLQGKPVDRTTVEVLCGFRPECVDALWKCDVEWNAEQRVKNEGKQTFIVTTNGSFWRAEVLNYIKQGLANYTPQHSRCVLVPCAADKPYPSPLHKEVLKRMPKSYELIIATGVLGLVPYSLWSKMPYYDSGLPNEWRLMNVVKDYFTRHEYSHVIAYTDFYSYAISCGIELMEVAFERRPAVSYVDPPEPRNGYLDLLDPDRLERLSNLFCRP